MVMLVPAPALVAADVGWNLGWSLLLGPAGSSPSTTPDPPSTPGHDPPCRHQVPSPPRPSITGWSCRYLYTGVVMEYMYEYLASLSAAPVRFKPSGSLSPAF